LKTKTNSRIPIPHNRAIQRSSNNRKTGLFQQVRRHDVIVSKVEGGHTKGNNYDNARGQQPKIFLKYTKQPYNK